MKKLTLLIIFISSFFIQSYVNAFIIEDSNNMKLDNWVFLWNKKLDEQKLRNQNTSYYSNNIINNFNNSPINFLKSYSYDNLKLDNYLYYEFKIDNDKSITSVKDFNWDELNYKTVDIEWIKYLKIYYNSFKNIIWEWYDQYQEYKYKNNEYLYSPEKITIIFEDNTNYEFLFRSNIIELDINNNIDESIIILDENKEININIEQSEIENIAINQTNYERAFDTSYENWVLKSIYTNEELDPYYENFDIAIYWKYDLYLEKYRVFNKSFCKNDFDFAISNERYDDKFYLENISEWYWYGWMSFKELNIDIKKYENWNIEDFDNYEFFVNKNWDNYFSLDINEDWLYKIEFEWISKEEYLCSEYYNTNIDTNFKENDYLMNNNVFYSHSWQIWVYWSFDLLFDDLIDRWFDIKWEYNDFLDKIEYLNFEIKSSSWDIIYTWDKSCIDNWECENEYYNQIENYIQNQEIFLWNINMHIKYKDIFSEEKTYTLNNIYYLEDSYYDFMELENWYMFFDSNIMRILDSNTSQYSIKIKNNNWAYINLDSIEENELDEIFTIAEENAINETWSEFFPEEILMKYFETELINRYWNKSLIIDWAIYINKNNLIYNIEIYKENKLEKNIDFKKYLDLSWNNLVLSKVSKNYYHFTIENNNLEFEGIRLNEEEESSIKKVKINNNIDAIKLINSVDYIDGSLNFDEEVSIYELRDENLLYEKNKEKILYILPELSSSIFILIPKEEVKNIYKISVIDSDDNIENYNKLIYNWEITNLTELVKNDTKSKISENNQLSIIHRFIENNDDTILFEREIILLNNSNFGRYEIPDYRISLDVKWENIKSIDEKKIFICKEKVNNLRDIEENESCRNKKDIDFFWYYFNWTNLVDYYSEYWAIMKNISFYIYGFDWIVNNDFDILDIEFNVEKFETLIAE